METSKPTTDMPISSVEPIYSTLAYDPDLLDIVALYVQEMPGRIERLCQLLEAGRWEELRRTAHQLKGSAGSHGFEPVSLAAADLESLIKDGAPEGEIRQAVERLVGMCRRVRAEGPD